MARISILEKYRGDVVTMLVSVILLIACGIVQSSEIHPVAPAGVAPIVTAASSQYFERTFNRLVAAPALLQPVFPIASAPVAPAVVPRPVFSILPIAPAPPVIVDATRTSVVPANPTNPPPSNSPVDPNISIAIATAHAAAPVATILLPPYPFGFPPPFGLLPQAPTQRQSPSDFNTREPTTVKTTTTVQATTTQTEEGSTTPVPSNIDNSFAQALPSNQNINFREYVAPQLPAQGIGSQQQFGRPNQRPQQLPESNQRPLQLPAHNQRPQQFPVSNQGSQQFSGAASRPQQLPIPSPWPQHVPQHLPQPDARPIKFKTNVEVVPVPLAYIAPPSPHQLEHHQHHHQHHHHHHQSLKIPHIHTFIPKTSKIIIRPVHSPLRIRTIKIPAGFATYGPPKVIKRLASKYPQKIRAISGNSEPTTFRPINRPFTKPPKL